MTDEQKKVLEELIANDEHPERGKIKFVKDGPGFVYFERLTLNHWERWHKSGHLSCRANYKDGKLDGLFESWYENGQLYCRRNYENGKEEGLDEEWYQNGQLAARTNYKNGEEEGLYEEWWENGQLKLRGSYKNGNEVGTFEEWYDTGELFGRTFYCDGSTHGTSTYWSRDGEILEMNNYKNGEKDGPQVSNIGLDFVTVSTYKDGSFQDLNSYHSIDEAMASLAQKKKITLKPKKKGGVKL